MKCSKCEKKPVYDSQGLMLCKDHFLDYFESKVFRTIKKYKLYQISDTVCVATSGGKDSLALLYNTMLYCNKYKIKFFAFAIDEGIKGYRDSTLIDLKKFCKKYKIKLHVDSFQKKIGKPLDKLTSRALKDLNKKPCTTCGILRRTYLNRGARELAATKLATGHNLDDESQSFIMNTFLGNMRHNASLGPISGLSTNKKFVPRVKPLYFVTEKETRLYTFLRKFMLDFTECPNIHLSYRREIRDMLNEFENKYSGTKNKIVNAFIEIIPTLKQEYKNTKPFQYCSICGDASAGKICNACTLEMQLVNTGKARKNTKKKQ